ncbi:MAG TPA: exosortase U [Pirellulaceae bacterium]|nr:exosortase U [Pirellulaceae bacterium]HMO92497.1 exosortase U [Pirellulaceae bacterium]HMP69020.1 exosortase U [Pirellulaceae bacterium]
MAQTISRSIASGGTSTADSATRLKSETLKILIPYAIIILAQVPLLFFYFKHLWTRPHYQSFVFALLAIPFFIYMWWPKSSSRPFTRSWFSVVTLILGIFFAVLATVFVTPWFAAVSMVCLLSSLLARIRNEETGRSMLPIALLLLVFIQPPMGADMQQINGDYVIITQLQTISAKVSSYFLDLLSYRHNLAGVAIYMPNAEVEDGVKAYSVEDACSGIQSFFTLLFLAALYVVYFKRPWFRGTLLLLSAMFWAVVINTLRIVVIPIADVSFGIDLSTGFLHTIWGYVALAIGCLLVFSTDQLLIFIFGPVDADLIDDESDSMRRRFSRFWNRRLAGDKSGETVRRGQEISPAFKMALWPCAGLMGLLGIVQAVDILSAASKFGGKVTVFDQNPLLHIEEHHAPAQIGDPEGLWTKVLYRFEERSRSSDLGQRSDTWRYSFTIDGQPAPLIVASLDQAFPGWHELTTCYKNMGNRLVEGSRRRIDVEIDYKGDKISWPMVEAEFVDPTGRRGYLLFSLFDRVGEPFDAPEHWNSFNWFIRGLGTRLSHRIRARLFHGEGYQVQVFVPFEGELALSVREKIQNNFVTFRETLRRQVEEGEIKMAREVAP